MGNCLSGHSLVEDILCKLVPDDGKRVYFNLIDRNDNTAEMSLYVGGKTRLEVGVLEKKSNNEHALYPNCVQSSNKRKLRLDYSEDAFLSHFKLNLYLEKVDTGYILSGWYHAIGGTKHNFLVQGLTISRKDKGYHIHIDDNIYSKYYH